MDDFASELAKIVCLTMIYISYIWMPTRQSFRTIISMKFLDSFVDGT